MTDPSFGAFIPAYNEEESITQVIEQFPDDTPIFIVDDGSLDTTVKKIQNAGIIPIRHPINLGNGTAIKTAFNIASKMGIRYVVTLDADGQHDPVEIPRLVEKAQKSQAGLIIGSRFLEKEHLQMKTYRALGIRFFSWYTTLLTGQKISDVTSGYRVYDLDQIHEIIENFNEKQYYAIVLAVKIAKKGFQIEEIDIKDIPRIGGRSKKGVLIYLYNLIRVIVKMTFS